MPRLCSICNSSHIRNVVAQKNWIIIECKSCFNSYTYPAPNLIDYEQEDFHQAAKENDKLLFYKDLPYDWKQLIDIQRDFVNKYVKNKGKILEVGCGEGLLLNELKNTGFKLLGLEASHSACDRAKKKGIHVIQGYFEQVNFEEQFDCIIMSQVLEHVPDLNGFLTKLAKLIPNGLLMLTQTNFKGLIPRLQKANWYAWVPEQHYWHFTLKGLSGILKKHGFDVLDYQYSSLVHPHDWKYKLAGHWPFQKDQFTVLFRHTK